MECNISQLNTKLFDLVEQGLFKMQPCSRRCDGSGFACVNRLIPPQVFRFKVVYLSPFDIGGQRWVPDLV
jgi:hypothetical protein